LLSLRGGLGGIGAASGAGLMTIFGDEPWSGGRTGIEREGEARMADGHTQSLLRLGRDTFSANASVCIFTFEGSLFHFPENLKSIIQNFKIKVIKSLQYIFPFQIFYLNFSF